MLLCMHACTAAYGSLFVYVSVCLCISAITAIGLIFAVFSWITFVDLQNKAFFSSYAYTLSSVLATPNSLVT